MARARCHGFHRRDIAVPGGQSGQGDLSSHLAPRTISITGPGIGACRSFDRDVRNCRHRCDTITACWRRSTHLREWAATTQDALISHFETRPAVWVGASRDWCNENCDNRSSRIRRPIQCLCVRGTREPALIFNEQAATLDDLLRKIFEKLLNEGEQVDPTRGPNVEIVGAALELTNPRARLSRTETRRKVVSGLGELCWYLRGTNDAEPILYYVQQYAENVEDDGTVHGGYGPRLFGSADQNQFQNIVDHLRRSPNSRRAVIQLFDRTDIYGEKRYGDVPCTCTLQLFIRSDHLHLVVNMRSNDAYLGLPHDIFVFTMLQEFAARELDIDLGRYPRSR